MMRRKGIALCVWLLALAVLFLQTSYGTPTGGVTGTLGLCVNNPPYINNSCNTTAMQNRSYSCQVNYTDADEDTAYFSSHNLSGTNLFNISLSGWINFTPGETAVGNHSYNISANDSSSCGGNASEIFNFTVSNINDPPYLTNNLPNVEFQGGTSYSAFFLNDYFVDPDGDNMSYSHTFSAHSITILDSSEVIFSTSSCLTGLVGFIATDPYEYEAESNTISVSSVDCVSPTTTTTTSSSGGGGGGGGLALCDPQWECYEYQDCLPNGTQRKFCVELVGCYEDSYEDWVWRTCAYVNCSDGVQQPEEEGVDCGGPCDDCPSCEDGVKNQGEKGIDCGGPCLPCDICENGVQDEGEEGIDCGGICPPCPSCEDGILNQGEEDVDCGGPCPPCQVVEAPGILPKAETITWFLVFMIVIVLCMFGLYQFFHKQIRTFIGSMAFAILPSGPRYLLIESLETRDELIKLLSSKKKDDLEKAVIELGRGFLGGVDNLKEMVDQLPQSSLPYQLKKVLLGFTENLLSLQKGGSVDILIEEMKMIVYLTSPPAKLLEKHVLEKKLSKAHFLRFQEELYKEHQFFF